MAPIYYDLSEQFLASGVRFKYYGIARTVMEVGYELARSDVDVRFVVFSPGHGQFFEVSPRLGAASPTGILDPGLPPEATPRRLRLHFRQRSVLRDALYPLVVAWIRRQNLNRWAHVPKDAVRPLSLDGKTLVSLGRPKMMADYLLALAGRNEHPRFFPLLHDMIPLHEAVQRKGSRFSSKFADDNHLVIRHSAGLLANSAFTKSEIESFSAQGFLPALPPVTAVPLAHELRPTDETVAVHPPEEPFLVCVGGQTGRKNLECIVSAMMLLSEKGLEVPMLVLAGARRKRTEQYLNRPEFAPIRDRIQILINPNQAELRALYEKALALVIPSRMEGWGLPLGEALWVGTPGLAASVPALQEVGGDLVRYFDPDAPAELAEQIDRLQSDPEDTQALRDRIAAARDELRSWKDVAQDILRAVQARLAAGTPD